MKKITIVLSMIFIILFSVSAEAGIGFKGGMNFTKWTGDDWGDAEDFEWKPGYKFGAFFTFPMTPIVKIQPEVYFASKGWKYEGEIMGEEYSVTLTTNYIEVPVLLKLDMNTGMGLAPSIFAGPYVGFLMGDPTMEMELGGQSEEEDISKDDFNSVDIGGVVGAAMDFNLATSTLTVEARYNMGFTSVANEDDAEMEIDVKNMGFSIMAGFSF